MKGVIIGCGLIARSHANAIKKNQSADLVAVCDVDFAKAQALASEFQAEPFTEAVTMLNAVKPDFAVICVPTFLHEHYVNLCALNSINVLCEKPLEKNLPMAESLVSTVRRSGIVFMTAQVVRFWPGYVEIKELYDQGIFGDVLMAHLRRVSSRNESYSKWLFNPELGGGAMHDMLVHDIDFLRYLFGEFSYCYANAVKDDTGCYNNVFANVVHQNGTHAVAEVSFNMQDGYPFSFSVKIVGTKATVEYDYSAGATIADRSSTHCQMKVWQKGQNLQNLDFDPNVDPYQTQMDYFLRCLESGIQPSVILPEESLDVIKMIDAIHESADNNSIVRVN